MKAIKLFAIFLTGLIMGLCGGLIIIYKVGNKRLKERIDKTEKIADKHLAIMNLLSMWIQNKEENLKIETYLTERSIKKIAIYGMGMVGERLYDELEKSSIDVIYCIDKNSNNIYKDVDVVHPDNKLSSDIDAVIVTAFTFFDEIEANLKLKLNVPIISIDDIIYSL